MNINNSNFVELYVMGLAYLSRHILIGIRRE